MKKIYYGKAVYDNKEINAVLNVLKNHMWPGNVRELENVLQRAMVICNENTITENDIMIDSSLQSTEKSLADRLQSGNMVATA